MKIIFNVIDFIMFRFRVIIIIFRERILLLLLIIFFLIKVNTRLRLIISILIIELLKIFNSIISFSWIEILSKWLIKLIKLRIVRVLIYCRRNLLNDDERLLLWSRLIVLIVFEGLISFNLKLKRTIDVIVDEKRTLNLLLLRINTILILILKLIKNRILILTRLIIIFRDWINRIIIIWSIDEKIIRIWLMTILIIVNIIIITSINWVIIIEFTMSITIMFDQLSSYLFFDFHFFQKNIHDHIFDKQDKVTSKFCF